MKKIVGRIKKSSRKDKSREKKIFYLFISQLLFYIFISIISYFSILQYTQSCSSVYTLVQSFLSSLLHSFGSSSCSVPAGPLFRLLFYTLWFFLHLCKKKICFCGRFVYLSASSLGIQGQELLKNIDCSTSYFHYMFSGEGTRRISTVWQEAVKSS